MIFRKKKFFWEYMKLNEFHENYFNTNLLVPEAYSRIHIFLYIYKYKYDGECLKKRVKRLFEHLVMSMQRTFSTRFTQISECGDFDRL